MQRDIVKMRVIVKPLNPVVLLRLCPCLLILYLNTFTNAQLLTQSAGKQLQRNDIHTGFNSGIETHFYYVKEDKTAHLQCSDVSANDKNQDSIKWFKYSSNSFVNMANCGVGEEMEDDDDDDDPDKDDQEDKKETRKTRKLEDDKAPRCFYVWSPAINNSDTQFFSMLKIKHLNQTLGDYTNYQCGIGTKILRSFTVRGEIRVRRKSAEDETERSVFVSEGDTLNLYCNYTDLQPAEKIEDLGLEVSWFYAPEGTTKNWTDITSDLQNGEGRFGNFSEVNKTTEPYHFFGVAAYSHRGRYKCSLNLKAPPNNFTKHHRTFPIEYKFMVRVHDRNRWMYPAGIVLLEVIFLATFTAIIWRKEEAKEKAEEDDTQPLDDSEDDSEVIPTRK